MTGRISMTDNPTTMCNCGHAHGQPCFCGLANRKDYENTTDRFIALKTWPKYWYAIEDGSKTFEIRRNDRPYAVGVVLLLQLWDPSTEDFIYDETGHPKTLARRVTYLLPGLYQFGLSSDFVVMAIDTIQ